MKKTPTEKPPLDLNGRLLRTREVAMRLGVTDRTVKEKCAAGVIRATKPGRDWLIPESALLEHQKRGQN